MKKITKYFPVLVLLAITCLTVLMNDMSEKEKYSKYSFYNHTGFIIPENFEHISDEMIDTLFLNAKESNVYLEKQIRNEKTDNVDVFITTDNLQTSLHNELEIQKINERSQDSFIATFQSNNLKQSDYILDFLNNDRFAFYKADAMKDQNIYRHGSYGLYYKNVSDYESFIQKAEVTLQTPKDTLISENWGQLEVHTDMVLTSIIVFLIFFIFFYFLIVLFQLYRETKKIGCLLLLGFRRIDITKIMIKKFVYFMSILSAISILLCMLMLPNAKLPFLLELFIIDLLLIILTILLSHFALLVVQKYANVSNILKKESILQKMSNLCLVIKCFVVGGIILFVISLLPLLQSSIQSINILRNNEILMDYAVFPRINVENSAYDDYDKFLLFFQKLEENNIDYMYVSFNDYLESDQQIVSELDQAEKSGTSFRMASVDRNYLKQYNLSCVDVRGNRVDLSLLNKEFYLLPQSKKSYTDKVKEKMQGRYDRYNIKDTVDTYYYEDTVFDTYDSVKGVKQVDSPLLRVIDNKYPFTYFENHTGIDVAGTGMNTALKFDIANNANPFDEKLTDCIKEAGLQDVLKKANFVSYKDYYGDELTNFYRTNSIFYGGIIISVIIYIILVLQTFILFIDSRTSEVLVKLLLGFSKKDIFKEIFYWNIGISLIPIVGIVAYSLFSGSNTMLSILGISASFSLIDIFLLLTIIKMMRFKKVYTKLKGDI